MALRAILTVAGSDGGTVWNSRRTLEWNWSRRGVFSPSTLANLMAVDALRVPFYSSRHPNGSSIWRNSFDLGNPDLACFFATGYCPQTDSQGRFGPFKRFFCAVNMAHLGLIRLLSDS